MNTISKKGFTLVELLIVIGILAVLATTAVVILNPAQLLAQARDSQRLSDMGSLNAAMALYLSDVPLSSVDLSAGTADANSTLCVTARVPGAGAWISDTAGPTTPSFTGTTNTLVTAANLRLVTGAGWLPVNFNLISSSSPLPFLPVDPSNTGDFKYRYACDNPVAGTTPANYELNACLESAKYRPLMGTDGGNKPTAGLAVVGTDTCASVAAGGTGFYETGTSLVL